MIRAEFLAYVLPRCILTTVGYDSIVWEARILQQQHLGAVDSGTMATPISMPLCAGETWLLQGNLDQCILKPADMACAVF